MTALPKLRQILAVLIALTCVCSWAGEAGEPGTTSITALVEKLGSEAWWQQQEAATALAERGGEALPFLLTALGDQNARTRRGACDALASLARQRDQRGPAAKSIRPLIAIFKADPDPWVRVGAAEALANFGDLPRQTAGEELRHALTAAALDDDEDLWVRRNAWRTLGKTRALDDLKPEELVPLCVKAIHFQDMMFRGGAIVRLGKLGEAAAPAVPALIEQLKKYYAHGTDGRNARNALNALVAIGPCAKAAIPLLEEMARNGIGGVMKKYRSEREQEGARKMVEKALNELKEKQ